MSEKTNQVADTNKFLLYILVGMMLITLGSFGQSRYIANMCENSHELVIGNKQYVCEPKE